MSTARPAASLAAALLFLGSAASGLRAQEALPDPAPATAATPSPAEAAAALTAGPADDPAAPAELLRTRDEAGDAGVEATAHFLTGQFLLRDGEPEAALEAFLAARELTPDSAEVLRSVVAVAFELGRNELGSEVAAELSDRLPNDWQLARTLARLKLGAGDAAGAQKYLKRAALSPDLPKVGPEAAEVLRGYAVLSAGLQQFEDAAEAYSRLLPLMSGAEGGLDFRTRTALLSDARTAPLVAARILTGVGRPVDAVKAFRLALTLEAGAPGSVLDTPEEPAARVQLATVLIAADQPAEALAEIDRLLTDVPAEASDAIAAAALVIQKALQDLDRKGEIVDRLTALHEQFPENVAVAVSLAAARADAGDLERAEEELEALVEQEPTVWLPLSTVRRLRGDAVGWLDAVAQAKAAGLDNTDPEPVRAARNETFRDAVLEAVPVVDPTPKDQDDGGVARAREITRAQLAASAGRAEEVEAGLRSALERERSRRFDAYLTLISVLNDLEQDERAAAVADEALADAGLDDPDLGARRAEFLTIRAQLHRQAGDTDAAVETLRKAEALTPKNPFFAYQAGIARFVDGDSDAAEEELERALKLAEPLPDGGGELGKQVRSLLSALLVRKGDFERGAGLLEEQLRLTPDDPGTLNDLGYLWADRGMNLPRAERMIRAAVAAEPDNAAYLDSLGWVLLKRGKPQEAREPLERAGKLSVERGQEGDGTIWSHLGDLWAALNEPQQARDAWKAALQRANTAEEKDEELIRSLKKKLGRE
ncbi:tetratricopeptide repeat protein [Alienimonas californiensis]|uniref:Tetratricopeptide repeat protein n=1 Tax=Alienimonas californiensis TaxID=2527989 RepID=A0A517PF19_9PLAN|nr:tetratricopeptide repeat protein [Alienimonas californiensis]QDT17965.1 tetratricopeptide repeat protein [Alienimonas californiensis]